MQMTEQEIIASYKGAKDKSKQIGILAELNDCGWEQIADMLKAGGIEFQPKKKKAQGTPWSQEEKEDVLRMRGEGKSYREIGEMLGREESAVRACANRLDDKKPTRQKTSAPAVEVVEEIPIRHLWARRILAAAYANIGADGKETTRQGLAIALKLMGEANKFGK